MVAGACGDRCRSGIIVYPNFGMVFDVYLSGCVVQVVRFVVYGQKQQKAVWECDDFEKSHVVFKILP